MPSELMSGKCEPYVGQLSRKWQFEVELIHQGTVPLLPRSPLLIPPISYRRSIHGESAFRTQPATSYCIIFTMASTNDLRPRGPLAGCNPDFPPGLPCSISYDTSPC